MDYSYERSINNIQSSKTQLIYQGPTEQKGLHSEARKSNILSKKGKRSTTKNNRSKI